ncbi:hypothetical protein NQ317_012531 [Molorchus minor]|uniref:Transcription initiation factor TFIID subunit 12 n=1 Tax=Molorchus minor TaxID=1323400 RepID=A0ABQ9K2E4_9CUCU|nr:hypothetical protein NQ317_012531 [Molorchus minor]
MNGEIIMVETVGGANLVGVQTVPSAAQNAAAPLKILPRNTPNDASQLVTKQCLQDLVRDTDPTLNLEEDVEELLLSYVDEFVDRCLNGAAMIAKNRRVNSIEVKDVQQFLNRNYSMWAPGLGTDELRPYKRNFTTDAHKQRIALIKKTLKKY